MSLLYDADGDQLQSTNAISFSGELTILQWIYPTDDTARQTLLQTNNAVPDIALVWRADLAGDEFQFFREGVSYGSAQGQALNYARYGLNKWICLVARAPLGANGTLWVGDETNTPAAPSSYVAQSALSSPVSGSNSVIVGNAFGAPTRWTRGRVGSATIWTRALSDAEVAQAWSGPSSKVSGSMALSYRLGTNGTTNVPDLSGNNNTGVITALSSPDGQPWREIRPRMPSKSRATSRSTGRAA